MRKPMGTRWVGRMLGLCLVGGATAALAQQPAYDATSAQDSRLTGTSDGQSTGLTQGMLSPTGTSSASDWDRMTPAQQQQQLMSVQQPMTSMTPSMSGVQPQTMDSSSMANYSSMTDSSSMTSQVSVAELVAQKEYEIAQLRTQVARLQQQLLQSQSAMQQMGAQNQGVGGSGTGGSGSSDIGNPNAQAPAGASGVGYTSGTGQGGSGVATQNPPPAIAEATVLQTGRVRSVDTRQLILEDDAGNSFPVPLAQGVHVFKGRQQMALDKLTPGKWVRTSADLYTPGKPVTRIDVLPKKP